VESLNNRPLPLRLANLKFNARQEPIDEHGELLFRGQCPRTAYEFTCSPYSETGPVMGCESGENAANCRLPHFVLFIDELTVRSNALSFSRQRHPHGSGTRALPKVTPFGH
jgi:hypothetical protein